MVGVIGFEPTTSRSRTERTTSVLHPDEFFKISTAARTYRSEEIAKRRGLYHPREEYSIKGTNRLPDRRWRQPARESAEKRFHDKAVLPGS